MASLATPSSYFVPLPAQHHAPLPLAEVAPWRRILAVEPDLAALHTSSQLLTNADYCVTRASGDRDLFALRGTKAAVLAILSDRLGHRLGAVAETVRRQWPSTRILILGQSAIVLEDYLYDERLYRSPDPRQVLADLESLYRGMWNQRSNTLDWDARRSAPSHARPPQPSFDPDHQPSGHRLQVIASALDSRVLRRRSAQVGS